MEDDEDVVITQQNEIQVFLNKSQQIVIREKDDYAENGYRYVCFSPVNAEKIVSAVRLCRRMAS